MTTITKIFIIGVSLAFFGCTPSLEQTTLPKPSDNASIEEVTLEVPETEPWPDNMVEFHKAMYFVTFAMKPELRMRFQPINLYNVASCIIDVLKVQYNYEQFTARFSGPNANNPDVIQEIYGISFKCSAEETEVMRLKMLNTVEPENAI